jgi:hypothetical protein
MAAGLRPRAGLVAWSGKITVAISAYLDSADDLAADAPMPILGSA